MIRYIRVQCFPTPSLASIGTIFSFHVCLKQPPPKHPRHCLRSWVMQEKCCMRALKVELMSDVNCWMSTSPENIKEQPLIKGFCMFDVEAWANVEVGYRHGLQNVRFWRLAGLDEKMERIQRKPVLSTYSFLTEKRYEKMNWLGLLNKMM